MLRRVLRLVWHRWMTVPWNFGMTTTLAISGACVTIVTCILVLMISSVSFVPPGTDCKTDTSLSGADLEATCASTDLNQAGQRERMDAARVLGIRRDAAALDGLIVSLDDPDPYVRGEVACALSEIGSWRAVDPLLLALHKYSSIAKSTNSVVESKSLVGMRMALEKITGQCFGYDVEQWKQWRHNNGVCDLLILSDAALGLAGLGGKHCADRKRN